MPIHILAYSHACLIVWASGGIILAQLDGGLHKVLLHCANTISSVCATVSNSYKMFFTLAYTHFLFVLHI